MQKINLFSYISNGIIINFEPYLENGEETKLYSFKVEDDENLTTRLRNSLKNKEVYFESIGYCAAALFRIIKDKSFSDLTTGEMISQLHEAFQKKFKEAPNLNIEYVGKRNASLFQAHFLNVGIDEFIIGKGRTKQEARADALKKCLGK